MADEHDANDVRQLWQSQDTAVIRINPDEIRRKVEQMETNLRRHAWDVYAVGVLSSLVIVALAATAPHPLQTVGAVLAILGFGYLVHEVRRSRGTAPAAHDGNAATLDHHRALLRHRLEFHRKRLWLRMLALTPGGILFFLGLAAARPALAPLAWLQLATFALAIGLMVPLNRKMAARYEKEIDDLGRVGAP